MYMYQASFSAPFPNKSEGLPDCRLQDNMTWSRDLLLVNTKAVNFWNILLAQAERTY